MSTRASDDQQGELQGVLSSINSIGMIGAPIVFTQVFAYFTAPDALLFMPGAAFLLATMLMLISWVVFASGRTAGNAP